MKHYVNIDTTIKVYSAFEYIMSVIPVPRITEL
jgi:hypothetical protein